MDTSAIVGWSGLVLSILGIIYSAVNHKHCRVLLCGRRLEFGIDVDSTETIQNEEKLKKEEEEKKLKKEKEEKLKKEEELKRINEDEKKKILYTPHIFKIQPLKF